jgi:hypothetical protein
MRYFDCDSDDDSYSTTKFRDTELKKLLALNRLNCDIWQKIKPSCPTGWQHITSLLKNLFETTVTVTFGSIPEYAKQFSMSDCWSELQKPTNNIFKAMFPINSYYYDLESEIKNLYCLNRETQERLIPVWKDALEKAQVKLGELQTRMDNDPLLFNGVRRILKMDDNGGTQITNTNLSNFHYNFNDKTKWEHIHAIACLFGISD